MSMLRYFFEIGTDKTLFDGLYISQNKVLCERHMGKYPVIFLSLKDVDGLSFQAARYRLIERIGNEAERFSFLAESNRLTENDCTDAFYVRRCVKDKQLSAFCSSDRLPSRFKGKHIYRT